MTSHVSNVNLQPNIGNVLKCIAFVLQVVENTSEKSETTPFPCDNFICLLQKFELLKTDNGYFVNRRNSKASNCVHFKCWLNKFNIVQTSFGYQFTDKSLQYEPTFSNENNFDMFVSQTKTPEGVKKRVISVTKSPIFGITEQPMTSTSSSKGDYMSDTTMTSPHTSVTTESPEDMNDANSDFYDYFDIDY